MDPHTILSKRVFCSLTIFAAIGGGLSGSPAQTGPMLPAPPLVIPYGPPLPATGGWHQEGVVMSHAMGAAGDDAWLTACSILNPADLFRTSQPASMLLRLVRRYAPSFPVVRVPDGSFISRSIQVIPGNQGAWAVWLSMSGLQAWWISAVTGLPSGAPLVLPASMGASVFQTAGDGETGWVVWNGFPGQQVATLTASGGPPRVRGRSSFDLNNTSYVGAGMMAAAHGQLMLVQRSGSAGAPGPVISRQVNADAMVSATEHPWTQSGPGFYENFYGVISYGTGWMAVWARALTPLVNGSIVYGQELEATGRPLPDQAAEPLFIEPATGYNPWVGVTSHAGRGAIITAKRFYEDDGRLIGEGLAMILAPGEPRRVLGQTGILDLGMANILLPLANPLPPLVASLRANQLDVMTTDGLPLEYFQHTIRRYDVSVGGAIPPSFQVEATQATGVQEEPAMAWTSTAAVLAWQQKSTTLTGPEIRMRSHFANGTSPDLILTSYDDSPFSSPDLAANGNRVLIVARQDYQDEDSGILDDVAGVITENGVPVTAVFKIGYGAGSQRAGCAAAFRDGFCVAWREELNQDTPEYMSRIRVVVLDRNGHPDVPGGYTMASSSNELSAPALAVNGSQFCVVWKRQLSAGTQVEASVVQHTNPGGYYRTFEQSVFPGAQSSSSPDVAGAGSGFIITGRSDRPGRQNEMVAAFMSSSNSNPIGIPVNPPPSGLPEGREPALADLGGGRTALFWLNHRNQNRASTQIWLAVSPGSGQAFDQATVIQTGVFDRDTLAVEGDGNGRVLVAVKSRAPGDEGVRFYQLAPGVNGLPELRLTPGPSTAVAGMALGWTPNLLFPASGDIVQTSGDLRMWTTAAGQLAPPVNSNVAPQAQFQVAPPVTGSRFYRLRAAFSGN